MKDSNFKVAFLDSGHGGLDVLSHYYRARGEFAAKDDLYYAADLAFMPYGDLPSEKIFERCLDLCNQMDSLYSPDLFVIACNTATAHAIDRLRDEMDVPFVGMEPYLNYINKVSNEGQKDLQKQLEKGNIGALVTPSTFKAPRFKSLKEKRDPLGLVEVLALPELAPLIESYIQNKDLSSLKTGLSALFHDYLPISWKEVILGCTHYPIIKKELEEILKAHCISPADKVIEQIYRKLEIDTTQQELGNCPDFEFNYLNTKLNSWRMAKLSEFLPWYLI